MVQGRQGLDELLGRGRHSSLGALLAKKLHGPFRVAAEGDVAPTGDVVSEIFRGLGVRRLQRQPGDEVDALGQAGRFIVGWRRQDERGGAGLAVMNA